MTRPAERRLALTRRGARQEPDVWAAAITDVVRETAATVLAVALGAISLWLLTLHWGQDRGDDRGMIRRRVVGGKSAASRWSVGTQHALSDGWRARVFSAFWGVPSGPIGWVGARVLPFLAGRFYTLAAEELDLQADDDLLDVGCGAGVLLRDRAAGVRYVAGVDASEIQVRLARQRLAERIAAGTAQIVLGDAAALPWPDGRFSAVASVNCLKFVPDPDQALREIHRVLRPGGRVVHITDPPATHPDRSGTVDALGSWRWSIHDSRRMMEQAGFADVSVTRLPATYLRLQLVRGVRPT